ncbi:MAG: hypothetical protein KAV87_19575, partial [Desulfobacteraceae bacterium]|nr:hypothetical protein [Desulfobacteraceae bacterium]
MLQKRRGLMLAISLLMILSFTMAACKPASPTPAPAIEPVEEAPPPSPVPEAEKNVFVYVLAPTFPDIDPSVSFSDDSVVVGNVYETLVFYNPPGSEDVLGPALATGWESSEDGLTWIFHLREGVKFHDGSEFTAEAVKYSFERTLRMGIGAAYLLEPIVEMLILDDHTIQF